MPAWQPCMLCAASWSPSMQRSAEHHSAALEWCIPACREWRTNDGISSHQRQPTATNGNQRQSDHGLPLEISKGARAACDACFRGDVLSRVVPRPGVGSA